MVKAVDVLNLLEGAIQKAAADGMKVVEIANLQHFAGALRKTVEDAERQAAASPAQLSQEAQMEHMRAQLTNWIEQHKRTHEWDVEMFRSVIEAGQSALKACILINGGAAVALLAFAGHLVEQANPAIHVQPIAMSMAIFVGGVFAGGLATASTYLSQWFFAGKHERTGFAFNITAILTGLASLAFFCWGGYQAYTAIVP